MGQIPRSTERISSFLLLFYIYFFSFFVFFSVIILYIMKSVIMLWAASIDGHLSSLVDCHCTDLYLFNLFVYLANKLSLSPSLSPSTETRPLICRQ